MSCYIYHFLKNSADGSLEKIDILGGKGANLAHMCNLGLQVPPGFTISSEVCKLYKENNRTLPRDIKQQIKDAIELLESKTSKQFGNAKNLLLVSVRSGSRFSMPGMLDTILNVGLNDEIVKNTEDKFILDSYRRLIQMYSSVVLKVESYHFEEALYNYMQSKKIKKDCDMELNDLLLIIEKFKNITLDISGQNFPQSVHEQLYTAINAVFESWNNKRAIEYRKIHDIKDCIGTAVNIQAMVFGNLNDNSASGVVFSRNPSTGENRLFGEYIQNSQGEDVVSGSRTPTDIDEFLTSWPQLYKNLSEMAKILERECKDMQDIEFTIEDGKLYLLQTRNGKRSAAAAVKIAVDMVAEDKITKHEAILRVSPKAIESLLHPRLNENVKHLAIARGLPASPGAASGKVVFCTEEAAKRANAGEKIILVKSETSPEDISGMSAAKGIITTCGGMTSHAAVVTRGMGKPCICACDITINIKEQYFTTKDDLKIEKNDLITIDGANGIVILGDAETSEFEFSKELGIFMGWIEEICPIKIRANAETMGDIKIAAMFNCDGIGLCRTEHMFFAKDRINLVRKMILAESEKERQSALEKLLPIQKQDFTEIFSQLPDKNITIRLLDPPLHEFLPHDEIGILELCKQCGFSEDFIRRRVASLKEQNPMLGHRGCRLAISYPEIYQMQVHAILGAAKNFHNLKLEIMVPFIINDLEFQYLKKLILEVGDHYNSRYSIGNMIELPSAALLAGEIAKHSDFFSFGTNDLTQTTLGISRDDCSKFMNYYQEKNILKNDPFSSLEKDSVGELIKIAVERARKTKNNFKFGVCGEQGGDVNSIEFFIKLGIDYISCSPYRIPVAKLAAAQFLISKNQDSQ